MPLDGPGSTTRNPVIAMSFPSQDGSRFPIVGKSVPPLRVGATRSAGSSVGPVCWVSVGFGVFVGGLGVEVEVGSGVTVGVGLGVTVAVNGGSPWKFLAVAVGTGESSPSSSPESSAPNPRSFNRSAMIEIRSEVILPAPGSDR